MIKKDSLPERSIDLRDIGGLVFYEDTHSYFNAEGVKYMGMTTFLKPFKSKFDAEDTARYKAIKENLPKKTFDSLKKSISKKFNIPTREAWTKVSIFYDKLCDKSDNLKEILENAKQDILNSWDESTKQGSLEHDKREKDVIENGFTWKGKYYPYKNKNILELTKDDVCVIPEILVWNHEKELCGLIDLPIFDKGVIHILDYKTNKKIDKTGFMGKKMKGIFRNYDECEWNTYSAQLHGYQKMACELTNFEAGECWIISTKSEKYKRKEDIYIECNDMKEIIDLAFELH